MSANNQTNSSQKVGFKEKLVKTIANQPLDQISVNPFIIRHNFSIKDYIKV